MQWSDVSEYRSAVLAKAKEVGKISRAQMMLTHIPKMPPELKIRAIQKKVTDPQTPFVIGAWVDCIHGVTCQLVIGPTGLPYVIGE